MKNSSLFLKTLLCLNDLLLILLNCAHLLIRVMLSYTLDLAGLAHVWTVFARLCHHQVRVLEAHSCSLSNSSLNFSILGIRTFIILPEGTLSILFRPLVCRGRWDLLLMLCLVVICWYQPRRWLLKKLLLVRLLWQTMLLLLLRVNTDSCCFYWGLNTFGVSWHNPRRLRQLTSSF